MEVSASIREARQKHCHTLSEVVAKQILAEYGIAVPKGYVAGTPDEAVATFATLQLPVVLKVIAPDVVHKSDIGGVQTNLITAEAVHQAATTMAQKVAAHGYAVEGFLVEEMAPSGCELVVGGVIDPRFGPLVMTGLGGIFVEVLKDVAFRFCPITTYDAWEMIHELHAAPILDGIRGQPPVSKEALIEVLLHVGGQHGLLLDLCADIQELDINPLIVTDTHAIAVDARFILTAPTKEHELTW
ncbi:MAG: acetate--CoA ligase family protein [Ktedonobacteraceae bacterium]